MHRIYGDVKRLTSLPADVGKESSVLCPAETESLPTCTFGYRTGVLFYDSLGYFTLIYQLQSNILIYKTCNAVTRIVNNIIDIDIMLP